MKKTALQKYRSELDRLKDKTGYQIAGPGLKSSPEYATIYARYLRGAAKEGKAPSKRAAKPTFNPQRYKAEQFAKIEKQVKMGELTQAEARRAKKTASQKARRAAGRIDNAEQLIKPGPKKTTVEQPDEPPTPAPEKYTRYEIMILADDQPFFQVLSYGGVTTNKNMRLAQQIFKESGRSGLNVKGLISFEGVDTWTDNEISFDLSLQMLFNDMMTDAERKARQAGRKKVGTDDAKTVSIFQAFKIEGTNAADEQATGVITVVTDKSRDQIENSLNVKDQ